MTSLFPKQNIVAAGVPFFLPLWSEKLVGRISIFWNLLRLFLWASMWYILENVPCALEKNVYPVA